MELDRQVLSVLENMEQSGKSAIKNKAALVLKLEEVYAGLR